MRQIYLDTTKKDNVIKKISFFSPSHGYVATDNWLGYTTDSGRTFIRKSLILTNVEIYGAYLNMPFEFGLQGIKAFSRDTFLLYGSFGFEPEILYTSNGGNSYKTVYHGPSSLTFGVLDMIFPENNNVGYAVDADRILKSTDRGKSWLTVKKDSGSKFTALRAINNNIVFAVGEKKILRTSSGGALWSTMPIPKGDPVDVYFLDANKGWLNTYDGSDGYMYYSKDGGFSWTLQNDPDASSFAGGSLKFINDSTGFALGGLFTVFKTTDSGKIWEPLPRNNDYSYLYYGHNDLFFINNNQFWAGGGSSLLEMTTNGGGTPRPSAYFKMDTTGLSTTHTVKLINYSKKKYSYRWLMNDSLISTDYNTTFTDKIGNRLITFKLIVSDGVYTDTMEKYEYFPGYPSPLTPTITSFEPQTATPGTIVTIRGENFDSTTNVSFGETKASSFTVESSTIIKAIVGNGTSGKVSVTTPKGTATKSGFIFLNPVTIVAMSTYAAPVGATVTITGRNFNAVADSNIVFFGAVKAQVVSATSTQLIVKVPIGATYKPVSVTVNKLTAYAKLPFVVKFGKNLVISENSFTSSFDASTDPYPQTVTSADFDGDGKVDIITRHYGLTTSTILHNTSTINNISFNKETSNFSSNPLHEHALGDMDGDGKIDIVARNSSNPNAFSIYKNTSIINKISFKEITFQGLPDIKKMVIADINGDGKADVCGLPVSGDRFIILQNTSTDSAFSFRSIHTYASGINSAGSFLVTDLNEDNKPDFVMLEYYDGPKIFVYKNTSNGPVINFEQYPLEFSVSDHTWDPRHLATGDFDLDGKPDLAVSTTHNYATGSILRLLRNNGANGKVSFEAHYDLPVIEQSRWFSIGDLDGDGKPDIAIANDFEEAVSVYKNTSDVGSISIAPKVGFLKTRFPTGYVTLSDINGDGMLDIALPDPRSDKLLVLVNKTKDSLLCKINARFTRTGLTTAPALITFTNNTTPDTAKTTYKWYFGNGDQSTVKSPTYTYKTPGTYYIRMVAQAGNCSSTFRDTIVVSAPIACSLTAKFTRNAPTAAPAVMKFTNLTTPDSANVSYKWYFGNDFGWGGSDSSTLKNPTYTYEKAGVYIVRLYATKGTCTSLYTDTFVVVYPSGPCNINAKFTRSGSLTTPALINFINQTTPDSLNVSYKWYFGNGDSTTNKSPSYTYNTPGTYYVRMVASRGTCSSTFRDTIVITAAPVVCTLNAKFTRSGSTTAPALITFTNQTTPDSANVSYKWYFGNTDSSTAKHPSYIFQSPGTYYVRMVALKGTCSSTFRDTIVITAASVACTLNAKFTRSGSTTSPALITFTNQTTPDSINTSYKWYFGNGDSSTAKNPSYTFQSAGTYYVRMVATKGTCSSTFRDTIVITAAPVACTLSAKFTRSGSTTAPALITFTNQTTPDSANTSYKWHFGNGDSSTAKNTSYTYQAAGTYYVRMTATRGTCTNSFRDTIVITSAPVVCNLTTRFSYNKSTTIPSSITFINQTTPDSASVAYKWYFGNGDSSAIKNPVYIYKNPGTYTVRLTATMGSCIRSKDTTILIPVISCNIIAGFTYTADSVQTNKIYFTNKTQSASQSLKYSWAFGDGTKDSSRNPQHIYWQAGTYKVCLQAFENSTCINTYCYTITVTLPSGRINISPNPAQNSINLYLHADRSSTYNIRISNFSGYTVKEIKHAVVPGANYISIHVADVAPGYYILTADNKDEQLQIKFLKN